MKLQLVIFCCILQSIYGSQESNDPNKIARSICSLQQDGNHRCGGAIINKVGSNNLILCIQIFTKPIYFLFGDSKRWIVSAGHCAFSKSGEKGVTEVLVGAKCLKTDNGKRYAIEKFVIHPNFKPESYGSDVALIRVKEEIEFNDRVQPISYSSQEFPQNVDAVHFGWNHSEVSDSRPVSQFSKYKKEKSEANIFLIFKTRNDEQPKCLKMTTTKVIPSNQCAKPAWHNMQDRTYICTNSDYELFHVSPNFK